MSAFAGDAPFLFAKEMQKFCLSRENGCFFRDRFV